MIFCRSHSRDGTHRLLRDTVDSSQPRRDSATRICAEGPGAIAAARRCPSCDRHRVSIRLSATQLWCCGGGSVGRGGRDTRYEDDGVLGGYRNRGERSYQRLNRGHGQTWVGMLCTTSQCAVPSVLSIRPGTVPERSVAESVRRATRLGRDQQGTAGRAAGTRGQVSAAVSRCGGLGRKIGRRRTF